MAKEGEGDQQPLTYYAVMEPKNSVVNFAGLIVDSCFGVLLKTGILIW
jgi:hypothetical protein